MYACVCSFAKRIIFFRVNFHILHKSYYYYLLFLFSLITGNFIVRFFNNKNKLLQIVSIKYICSKKKLFKVAWFCFRCVNKKSLVITMYMVRFSGVSCNKKIKRFKSNWVTEVPFSERISIYVKEISINCW